MEFLRAGEALLPFLAPSLQLSRHYRICAVRSNYKHTLHLSQQAARTYTVFHPHRAQNSTPSPAENDSNDKTSASDDLSSLLDSTLDFKKGTPTAPAGRTSNFKSQHAQSSTSSHRTSGYDQGGSSSIDDLLSTLKPHPSGSLKPAKPGAEFNLDTSSTDAISQLLESKAFSNTFAQGAQVSAPTALHPPSRELGAKTGRTVLVEKDTDPAQAFRQLEIRCGRNKVKSDAMSQRFHERPGLKRKRLKSQRWRRRFKEQFRATVQLVQKMKKQGW